MPTQDEARLWYTDADPIHNFDHVLRVYHMAERIGSVEGADLNIVRAAALLHDAQGSAPGQTNQARANHHTTSANFALQILSAEGWPADRISAVQHCIAAHRYRSGTEKPQTLEAKVIFDADKLDVLGAIGVARTIAYAVLDGQPFYAPPSDLITRTGQKEPGEPHSSYHEYLFKLSKVKDRLYTQTAKAIAAERHRFLTEFYDELIAEIHNER